MKPRPPERCPSCFYSLTGLPENGLCPECSYPYDNNSLVIEGVDVQRIFLFKSALLMTIALIAIICLGAHPAYIVIAAVLWVLVLLLRFRKIRDRVGGDARSTLLILSQGVASTWRPNDLQIVPWDGIATVKVGLARFEGAYRALRLLSNRAGMLWRIRIVRKANGRGHGSRRCAIDFAFRATAEEAREIEDLVRLRIDNASVPST